MPSGSPKESAWEVVDHKAITPVSSFGEDDVDVEVIHTSQKAVRGTYLFDIKDDVQQVQRAVIFARQQFMKETTRQGYNMLLIEGWKVTIFQKGAKRRVEVQYYARPAVVSGKVPKRPPPFIGLLSSKLH